MKITKILKIVRSVCGSMATVKKTRLDSGTFYVKVVIHAQKHEPMRDALKKELVSAGYPFEQGHYINEICALLK